MIRTFQVHLFGTCELVCGDAPLSLDASPRLQALLAYLLLHRAAPQPRRQIAFLLWPDSAESQAYANLRSLLLLLRRTLPDAACALRADRATLHWQPDGAWSLDVDDFERALAHAAQATRAGDAAAARVALGTAVAVYAGDLLPGLYDTWLAPERERLRQAYLDALEQLAQLAEAARDLDAAVTATQRLLLADPLCEPAYGRLMRLHAARGDHAAVRRVFHACATTLQRELGVEPDAATRELYERLLERHDAPPSRHNLPPHLDPVVGREAELALLRRLLADGGCRLLTLTGPGGVGKTRLACQLAAELLDEFPGGAWFVPLAAVVDPARVPAAIVQALALQEPAALAAPRGRVGPALAVLTAALRERQALLVLDNFEQVTAAAPLVAELLATAPGVTALATSRVPLHLAGERQFAVPPLALPAPDQTPDLPALLQVAAVRLFVDRARAVRPGLALTAEAAAAVAAICARLDGLPLAIELAAAWIKLLSPAALLARLDQRLALLVGGAAAREARHRTLRDTLAWSYSLLEAPEQALFARLAVFAGGCTLPAVEQVVAGVTPELHTAAALLQLLYALVDKSLLQVRFETVASTDGPRFTMLETIHEYALEQLAVRADAGVLHDRHARYYLELAERAEPELLGPAQGTWLDRLDEDYANLAAALGWLLDPVGPSQGVVARPTPDAADRAVMGLRIVTALERFWALRAHTADGRVWVEQALVAVGLTPRAGAPPHPLPPALHAHALAVAGFLHWIENDLPVARAQLEASVALWRALGDLPALANALEWLGAVRQALGDAPGARAALEDAMACWRVIDRPWASAKVLAVQAAEAFLRGDLAHARALNIERLGIERAAGTRQGVAAALLDLGGYALLEGDQRRAAALLRESLELWHALSFPSMVALCLEGWGWLFSQRGLAAPDAAPARAEQLRVARVAGYVERLGGGRLSGLAVMFTSDIFATHFAPAVAAARAVLGDAAFAAAWTEGRACTEARAIAIALEPGLPT